MIRSSPPLFTQEVCNLVGCFRGKSALDQGVALIAIFFADGAGDDDLLAVFERIGRIDYDGVLRRDALQDFDAVAEITADGELLQYEPAIGADDRDESAFRPEKQRIDRHRKTV